VAGNDHFGMFGAILIKDHYQWEIISAFGASKPPLRSRHLAWMIVCVWNAAITPPT